MADDETSPLKAKSIETMLDISPHYSPPLEAQQSTLKIQLLQLLRSTDISDDNIEHELNSHYDKQILLEEITIIQRLHDWIEKKGKPAIQNVNELQMKCDEFEQQISSKNIEIKTLHYEINKLNKDKNDLQIKYDQEKEYKTELKQTIETLQIHTQNNINKDSDNSDTNNNELHNKINELNFLNHDLKSEIINVTKLNMQYMEQHTSLKTIIQTKENTINELTNDRNQWEISSNKLQNDLLERLQEINQLRTDNANYKHQIEILEPNNMNVKSKTIRGGVLSADLSNEPNMYAFINNSTANVLNGIYAQQSTFSTASLTVATVNHRNVDSMDFDKVNVQYEKQLKDEKSAHEKDIETLTGKMEQLKQTIHQLNDIQNKYNNDVQSLNEEIERLKQQNAAQVAQQNKTCNACNTCIVM